MQVIVRGNAIIVVLIRPKGIFDSMLANSRVILIRSQKLKNTACVHLCVVEFLSSSHRQLQ